jgi:hypothetical protein
MAHAPDFQTSPIANAIMDLIGTPGMDSRLPVRCPYVIEPAHLEHKPPSRESAVVVEAHRGAGRSGCGRARAQSMRTKDVVVTSSARQSHRHGAASPCVDAHPLPRCQRLFAGSTMAYTAEILGTVAATWIPRSRFHVPRLVDRNRERQFQRHCTILMSRARPQLERQWLPANAIGMP